MDKAIRELTDAEIDGIVFKSEEPPKVPAGHVWKRDERGRIDTEGNYMPDPHSTALTCVACSESFCIFCPDDGILGICDQVLEGEIVIKTIEPPAPSPGSTWTS